MARVALPQRWSNILVRQRGPLRLYQWLWLLLCTISGLAVAGPSILSQPVVYHATAETKFDTAKYLTLYKDGAITSDFQIAVNDASSALRQRANAQRDVRLGQPNYRIDFVPQQPGIVQALGIAPTPQEAQRLANAGAEELARQIQAAGGRDILWRLLNQEYYDLFHGQPADGPFHAQLRAILENHAFPLSREIEGAPPEIRRSFESLSREDQGYLARALESRYDLWDFEINTRNATLDAICGTSNLVETGAREQAIKECLVTRDFAVPELVARNQAIARRQVISEALSYLLKQGLEFQADAQGPVYRVAASEPTSPEPRNIAPLLALATIVGLVFGGLGVAIDQAAGVMPKLNELWGYRELIRNLVLRDLRVRYKGSALGYLWTQLAPLLLMLVFWFVFSFFFQSAGAMFPVFLIVGLLPWNACSEAVNNGTRCILDNSNLIKKVFFPREVLPLVTVFSSMVNFVLSLPMMFVLMLLVQLLYAPLKGQLNFSWTFAYLPVLLVLEMIFLSGVVLFTSALAVFFRDFVHLIGILLQFWFFLTPVVYSLDTVPHVTLLGIPLVTVIRWLNPMASLIDFYRDILYGNFVGEGSIPTPGFPALNSVLRVLITSLMLLAIGYWFFQRRSGRFGEEI